MATSDGDDVIGRFWEDLADLKTQILKLNQREWELKLTKQEEAEFKKQCRANKCSICLGELDRAGRLHGKVEAEARGARNLWSYSCLSVQVRGGEEV